MNEDIITSHNKVVTPNDDVYVLGDVAFGNNPKVARELVSRLNGNLYLIKGNHEKIALQFKDLFQWIKPLYEMTVHDPDARGGKRLVTMCHYSMRVWNRSHHGVAASIHVFGHSHSGLDEVNTGASMDVGIDSAAKILGEYRPFSYKEVVDNIKTKMTTYGNSDDNED